MKSKGVISLTMHSIKNFKHSITSLLVISMSEIKIEKRGMVYFIRFNDGSKAWLSFKEEDGKMYLMETYTPEAYRGRGYARMLVEAAVKDARVKGLKIVPICSYSVYYFIKSKKDRDILADPYRQMDDEELRKYFEKRLAEERSRHRS